MQSQNLNLKDFTIQKDEKLVSVLQKIEFNENGTIFVLDKLKVIGVLSDGDIRRSLINGVSLDEKCGTICKKNFVYALVTESEEEIQSKFSESIKLIPLLESDGNIIKVLHYMEKNLTQLAEPNLGKQETKNILECMNSGMISSLGKYVYEFESLFNEFIGSKRSFAVANGTQALALALSINGIGFGDEVIIPDLTFAATANAIIQVGATPVIIDVDIHDWNLDISLIESAVTNRTKAIIPVHLYGLPCSMSEIMKLAKEHNLIVIEDAAEALGSKYGSTNAGALGDFSIFSFYANKIITTGEGGMLCVNKSFDYEQIIKMRSHGMSLTHKYWHEDWGTNVRLTNLQASIGVAQMQKLDQFIMKKKMIHERYLDLFQELQLNEMINYRRTEDKKTFNSHWLSCFHVDADIYQDLVKFLNHNLIETRPIFFPLHMQPAFNKYKSINHGKSWNSKIINEGGICLPSGTTLTDFKQEKICQLIHEFFSKGSFNG
jgi:perosamine synthetase